MSQSLLFWENKRLNLTTKLNRLGDTYPQLKYPQASLLLYSQVVVYEGHLFTLMY